MNSLFTRDMFSMWWNFLNCYNISRQHTRLRVIVFRDSLANNRDRCPFVSLEGHCHRGSGPVLARARARGIYLAETVAITSFPWELFGNRWGKFPRTGQPASLVCRFQPRDHHHRRHLLLLLLSPSCNPPPFDHPPESPRRSTNETIPFPFPSLACLVSPYFSKPLFEFRGSFSPRLEGRSSLFLFKLIGTISNL